MIGKIVARIIAYGIVVIYDVICYFVTSYVFDLIFRGVK